MPPLVLVVKIFDHRRKTRKNYNFLMKQSPFLNQNFIPGSMMIVDPHNVELCEQYFLQECPLLIRKTCNYFLVIAFMENTTVEIKTCKTEKNINFYCK